MSYRRHNFVVGQKFTAAHANEIEDGIIANESKINGLNAALEMINEGMIGDLNFQVEEPSEGHVVLTFGKIV